MKLIKLSILKKSNLCNGCHQKDKEGLDKDSEEYNDWAANHQFDCTKNHGGSSGAMEPAAIKAMFQRSVTKHGIRYAVYVLSLIHI